MAASAAHIPILRRVTCAALLIGAVIVGGSSLAVAQGTTSTETPTTEAPTTSQAPTTEAPSTVPTSELPTTTIDSGSNSDDDIAWGWIAIAVLGGLLLLLIIINAIRAGQNRSRAKGSWRGQSLQICQDASATRDLILQTPGQGDETARWAAVEQRTDALTADLDNLTGNAPDSRSADASASLRQALRSLRFSVEANRLIRDGDAPDARQLAAADADIGERENEFEAALGTLRAVSVDWPPQIAMQTIGPGTTLAPAPDTTAIAVDDEQFVVNTARAAVHRLTGTAATVWQVLDGSASLDVLAGELAEVYGAEPSVVLDDLERLGNQLAALGLVRDTGHAPATTTQPIPADKEPVPDPRYIAVPPSTWGTDLNRLGWAGTLALDVGEFRLGVRCTSPTILGTLARRLSPYLVDDPDVPANYSLEIFEEPASRKRHRLYEANTLALRSRDPASLVRAIDTMLAVYETTATGPVALSSLAAIGAGGALLIPDGKQLRATAGTSGSPLSHPIWAGPVILDATTTELVLPTLERAKAPTAGDPAGGDVAIASPGRYRLRAVCYVGRGATEIERIDGTDAVYALTQLLPLDTARSARHSIEVARELASRGVTVMAAPPSALNELLTS